MPGEADGCGKLRREAAAGESAAAPACLPGGAAGVFGAILS
jgi:hypothetical protein